MINNDKRHGRMWKDVKKKIIFTFRDTSNKWDCPSPPVLGPRPYNNPNHLLPCQCSQGHPKDTKVKTKMLSMILSTSLAALVAGSALPHPEMPPLQERGGLQFNSIEGSKQGQTKIQQFLEDANFRYKRT